MSAASLGHEERTRRREGVFTLLAVQLFFGLFPLFGKVAFASFSPFEVGAARIGVGALALGLLAFAKYGRAAVPQRADVGRLALCALLGIVLNMVFFLEGLRRSTAINTALLLPLIPVFTAVVAIVLRAERFEPVRALGMAIAFAGAGIVLFQKGPDLGRSYLTGNLLVVTNELFYAIYLVIARPLLKRYPPLVVTAWVFLLSVWAIPFLLLGDDGIPRGAATTTTWTSLAYIVVFPTIFSYLLNVYALARVSASTAAAFIFIQPMITVAGGVLVLDETMPHYVAVAAALTFGGVWLVARRRTPKVAVVVDETAR